METIGRLCTAAIRHQYAMTALPNGGIHDLKPSILSFASSAGKKGFVSPNGFQLACADLISLEHTNFRRMRAPHDIPCPSLPLFQDDCLSRSLSLSLSLALSLSLSLCLSLSLALSLSLSLSLSLVSITIHVDNIGYI